MPVEKDMPLTEQMKFDLEAENFSPEQIELIEGDTQLDEDGGAPYHLVHRCKRHKVILLI